MKQLKTGILFFSRSTQVEARMKNWRGSYSVNLKIAQHLIQSTQIKLSTTGIDVIEIDESAQRGHTFGAKITNAFEDGFALGYDRLILVGNDCIGLTPEDILKSAIELEQSNCVLGPAKNGGLYLVGLSADHFQSHHQEIEQLPWRTKHLFEASKSVLEYTVSNSSLRRLFDFNFIDELNASFRFPNDFSKVFIELQFIINSGFSYSICIISDVLSVFYNGLNISRRGPPSMVSV